MGCILALNSQPKWTSEFRDLKAGNVVLVIQPDTPRGHWPLERIAEVYPERDGHTLVAKAACVFFKKKVSGWRVVRLARKR